MLSAQNILAVTVVMKMVLNSLFIVQCAVVAEAWSMQNASCGASCHQRIIIQRAIPTCDIFLVVIILSSIIQCSMIYNKMLSLNFVIKIDKKINIFEIASIELGLVPESGTQIASIINN